MSLKPLRLYPVTERFFTFQGEGDHMGRSAFFIRTYGCPVHCPWCDSAGTWHPKFVPDHIHRISAITLSEEVKRAAPLFVVVTGGEPAAHDLTELTTELAKCGYPVHLETSGALPIRGAFSWITVSPKKWKMPLAENINAASEFKIIVESKEDIYVYLDAILKAEFDSRTRHVGGRKSSIWLHPEWSRRNDPEVLNAISEAVKHDASFRLRAGYQLHKLYKVDSLDPRSAPLVPLGGDPSRGY